MSPSADFNVGFQYGLTDTLKLGFQELAGADAGLPSTLGANVAATPTTSLLGLEASTLDAGVTRFSVDYDSGPWSAHAAVVTGSLFTLEDFEIQNRITSNWTADVVIERTVAGFSTFDAGELAVSGQIGDVTVSLNYLSAPGEYAFEPESALLAVSQAGTPLLRVSAPLWGWQWTLSGIGGTLDGYTLTVQRSQPNVAVTVSGAPFGVWLTHNSQF
jgi:hypothetical protein